MLENAHKFICWLVRCFIDACGITLLFMFFHWPLDPRITAKDISIVVCGIYLFFLAISGFAWLFRPLFQNKGEEKVQMPMTEDIKKNNAVHEAGHAVICQKLHIPIRGIYIDWRHSYVNITLSFMCAEDIHNVLLVLYAGADAEEICCKKRMVPNQESPESDFNRANALIKDYIVLTDDTVSKTYLEAELADKMISYSKQFYEECKGILLDNEDLLHTLSIRLYEEGSMTKKQVEEFFKENQIAEL